LIARVGGAAALLLFIILLIKFLAQLPSLSALDAGGKAQRFMQILIVSVTIVVVAVPEGLPLAVTLSLAYATTRMLKDNNLVRVLKACETMGNATTICSDKTGTLTTNRMTVIAGTIGIAQRFGENQAAPAQIEHDEEAQENEAEQMDATEQLDAIPLREFFDSVPQDLADLLRDSVVLNSTAFEGKDDKGNKEFIGSKTETALLGMARDYLGLDDIETERHNAEIVQPIPFSSDRKCMGIVVKMDKNGRKFHRLYVKGASEILLRHSAHVVDISSGAVQQHMLSERDRKSLEHTIVNYATRSLRTIALVYRDFQHWPPRGARLSPDDKTQAEFDDVFQEMVFIGVVGIMDPLRPGVTEAVEDCRKAGVFVRMVTGDNILTAKAIAAECGIFTRGGIVMEGPRFRTLTKSQMDQIIPRLQVLARSSPEDKRILVKRLKELGETVAVTGDGTNDGPALKMADVGFSMGIAGTEVAKEASSIILMDDNFASIIKAILWGRCVSDSVKKFLQVLRHSQPNLIIVPIDRERHSSRPRLRLGYSQPNRTVSPYRGAIAVGQFDHGYLCCAGTGNRSSDARAIGPEARTQERLDHNLQHVENDIRTSYPPTRHYLYPQLCGNLDIQVMGPRQYADRHIQHVCLASDL
jgi:P-type Ca2+ transporter type 2C